MLWAVDHFITGIGRGDYGFTQHMFASTSHKIISLQLIKKDTIGMMRGTKQPKQVALFFS